MYSKRAKYKQIANVDWLGQDMMQLLAINNSHREDFDECVRADYYWLPGLGLYVIIDVRGRDIMNSFRGFTVLRNSMRDNYGREVWSNLE